jgi:hypothetical protein
LLLGVLGHEMPQFDRVAATQFLGSFSFYPPNQRAGLQRIHKALPCGIVIENDEGSLGEPPDLLDSLKPLRQLRL